MATNTMKITEAEDRCFRDSGIGKMMRFLTNCLVLQDETGARPRITVLVETHTACPQFVFRGSKYGSENGRHTLGIGVTSLKRLFAHWEGYALQNGYSQGEIGACKNAALAVVARSPWLLT